MQTYVIVKSVAKAQPRCSAKAEGQHEPVAVTFCLPLFQHMVKLIEKLLTLVGFLLELVGPR